MEGKVPPTRDAPPRHARRKPHRPTPPRTKVGSWPSRRPTSPLKAVEEGRSAVLKVVDCVIGGWLVFLGVSGIIRKVVTILNLGSLFGILGSSFEAPPAVTTPSRGSVFGDLETY